MKHYIIKGVSIWNNIWLEYYVTAASKQEAINMVARYYNDICHIVEAA